MEFKIKAMFEQ